MGVKLKNMKSGPKQLFQNQYKMICINPFISRASQTSLGVKRWLLQMKPVLNSPHLQMECCGWIDRTDWSGNMVIVNSSQLLFPCSCQNISLSGNFSDSGFCEAKTPDWPVYDVVNGVFRSSHILAVSQMHFQSIRFLS